LSGRRNIIVSISSGAVEEIIDVAVFDNDDGIAVVDNNDEHNADDVDVDVDDDDDDDKDPIKVWIVIQFSVRPAVSCQSCTWVPSNIRSFALF